MRPSFELHRGAIGSLCAAILAMGALGGCGGGSETPATTPQEADMAGFVLSSPSFVEAGSIPVKHSCDGQDVSPALVWEGAPSGTQSLALIVDDPDARGFIHWVAYNISGGATGGLPEGAGSAAAPPQGRNDFGRTGWGGPCPPGGTHHYRFTLYALSAQLSLRADASAADVRNAVSKVLLGHTTLTATYTRRK